MGRRAFAHRFERWICVRIEERSNSPHSAIGRVSHLLSPKVPGPGPGVNPAVRPPPLCDRARYGLSLACEPFRQTPPGVVQSASSLLPFGLDLLETFRQSSPCGPASDRVTLPHPRHGLPPVVSSGSRRHLFNFICCHRWLDPCVALPTRVTHRLRCDV